MVSKFLSFQRKVNIKSLLASLKTFTNFKNFRKPHEISVRLFFALIGLFSGKGAQTDKHLPPSPFTGQF
jgi:hypothetical protein